MSADNKQVGGNHYKVEGELQHWNVVAAMGWDYFVGNATKYLWRLGKKGGPEKALEDIEKAIHYLEKKREIMKLQLAQGVPEPGRVFGETLGMPKGEPVRGILPQPFTPNPAFFGLAPDEPGAPTRDYVDQD